MTYLSVLKPFLTALISGVPLVLVILLVARRYGVGLDRPGSFRIHRKPIPRIGGIALWGAFLLGSLSSLLPADISNEQVSGVAITVTIIAGVGLVDDIFDLAPRTKFIAQISIAILATAGFGILIPYINNPFSDYLKFDYPSSILISSLWMVGIMNVTNLLDGIDGLATGMTAILSFILVLVAWNFNQRELSILAAALLGSTLAFLIFNFSPAKIFMGDSGSLFLGLLIGELSILSGAKLAIAMLVLGIAVADTAYTIIRRLKTHTSIVARDTNHFHHRLLALGLSHRQVCLFYYIFGAGFGLVTLIPVTAIKMSVAILLLLMFAFMLRVINRRNVN